MNSAAWKDRLSRISKDTNLRCLALDSRVISTWSDFQTWLNSLPEEWIFRGHRCLDWHLDPSFERLIFQEVEYPHGRSYGRISPQENETRLIEDFKRAAHLFYPNPPSETAIHDWLALMQHHGCPTRMLDWTRSPYIALFFAMIDNSDEDGAIWALDSKWVDESSSKIRRDFESMTNAKRKKHSCPFIVRANLQQVNPRIVAQQGELLATSDYEIRFESTLLSMIFNDKGHALENPVLSCVRLMKKQRLKLLRELQLMNINHATLFPGLDGFSKSLGTKLEFLVEQQVEMKLKKANPTLKRG